MKKIIPFVFILLVSCQQIPTDQYTKYFDNTEWVVDSVSDKHGPTVMINHDGILFSNGIMKTFWLSDPNHFSISSFHVSSDTLFIGAYQSFKILHADEQNIVYKYHVPISTGNDKWEFTYHLSRKKVLLPPHDYLEK